MASKGELNREIIEKFVSIFPPDTKWNQTVTRNEFIKLNNVLLKQKYTHQQISDAIDYAKRKGKRYKTIASIAYIIEESIAYHTQLAERELERQKLMESQQHEQIQVDTTQVKPNRPSWLGVDDYEEV